MKTDSELATLLNEIEVSTIAVHALMLRRDREIGELRLELSERRVRDFAADLVLGTHSVRHDRIPA